MAEVTRGMIYDGPIQLQAAMARLAEWQAEIAGELRALERQMFALSTDTAPVACLLSRRNRRLERIERRLARPDELTA